MNLNIDDMWCPGCDKYECECICVICNKLIDDCDNCAWNSDCICECQECGQIARICPHHKDWDIKRWRNRVPLYSHDHSIINNED